ncbi:serine/threonine protein kinase [Variovorax paradoxus]|uniref:Serine/threonine-protein kinase PK-1 n=1 Tax=Variovorax paradoxus TaxID=34073 RepID=A0A679J4F7_VARPD|nr:Serine/threonine-protein kinase PK-1 [Variovorax paradoxus]
MADDNSAAQNQHEEAVAQSAWTLKNVFDEPTPSPEQVDLAINALAEQEADEHPPTANLPEFHPPSPGFIVTSEATGITYVVGEFIGEGSFGAVFEAADEWQNKLAVKVLKPAGTFEEMHVAAYAEVQRLLHLRHPNVTYVYDAFVYRETFYIVTERCYRPLSVLLYQDWVDPSQWLTPLARCLLQAVQYLHSSNFVHQDIHFGNVFISFVRSEMAVEGQAVTFKLGDLGITKLAGEIDVQNTRLNPSMFAPEALDPHQFGPLDHRMDLYHCGLLFLQLLAGRELSFTHQEILDGAPRKLAELLPEPYRTAISKALRRHVGSRTQTAMELWRDLNPQPLDQAQLEPGANV